MTNQLEIPVIVIVILIVNLLLNLLVFGMLSALRCAQDLQQLLLNLLVFGMLSAPLAVLRKLKLAWILFQVLPRIVTKPLTSRATKLN